ncbi:urea ABC transporter, permease protein UrtB [Hoeflea phototrophica DFL-43]|jgi:urea transport system permease protein|uniref:Urea ABC transporter, permease protein UrtB n=1 Tax=Hoeflea phototrophica (strain DSM 17068 / NCIMB 14078 / DFL-43) TaxID=411684 RepID=A9CZH1_HOEPD|nr:urea ABC transporter permease subunit UrtB [Hoeflea phototrophica]EDQ34768.1 urea ABC transporter, permease protein UrtB [Hoeflea phototrophica DFL-43]
MDIGSITSAVFLGLSIGSVFLVAALGLAIIYGTAGVINMAHGELIMLGAYSTFMMQTVLGLPFFICIPLSFVIVGFIGYLIEKVLISSLYNRPLDTLLATWGVSLVLMQGVRIIFGSDPKYVEVPSFLSTNIDLGIVNLSTFRLFVMFICLIMVLATWYLFYRTTFGIKVRAVTQNKDMAASFGINSSRIYSITFAIGAGLAGVAGSLFGAMNIVLPTMGTSYVVEAFLMVVAGGGGLLGSILASALTGQIQSAFAFIYNDTYARFLVFVLIVIFLRFRPQGMISAGASRR